ncbi:hypothetical protein [Phenylobacterium sp.]|jgi:phosphotriesterase-related protein|uniref:phosphotriesterase family protein n=1 Tax=Phenylobacterium sp. TaxID=1871053 RepID=UPI0037842B45
MGSHDGIARRSFLAGAAALSASTLASAAPARKFIQTVNGLIPPSELGVTSMHEHTLLRDGSEVGDPHEVYDAETLKQFMAGYGAPAPVPEAFFPQPPDHPITLENRHYLMSFYANSKDAFLLDEALMSGELGDFRKLGGRSVLDVSVANSRGDPRTQQRMSKATGVNIIMSTGINTPRLTWKKYKEMSLAQLTEFFEGELNVGIRDTKIRAGHIKLHCDRTGATDAVLHRALDGAASVSRNTGVPVTIHVYSVGDATFNAVLDRAVKAGMPKDRMIIAHFPTALRPMDYKTLMTDPSKFVPNLDIGYRAMDRGFLLSFDLFGAGDAWIGRPGGTVPNYDIYSFAAIYQYCQRGYADRLVMATDTWTRMSTRKFGGGGISQLLNFVVPTLKQHGVSQAHIDQMMIHTPARMLAYRDA